MKRTLSLLVLLSAAIPSFATLALYEPFDYTVGSIVGQSPAAGQAWQVGGTANPAPQVNNSGLSVPGLQASLGGALTLSGAASSARVKYLTPFAEPAVGADYPLYYSLAFKVTDISVLGTAGAYFFGFNNLTASSAGTFSTYGTKLYIVPGSDASHFKIGLAKNNKPSPLIEITDATQNYAVGDTLFVVGSYTQVNGGNNINGGGNDGPIKLWINPDSSTFGGGSEAIVGQSQTLLSLTSNAGDLSGSGNRDIESFAVRQASGSWASVVIDELRVGTTWADVTPTIPEPSTAALALLAGAVIAIRRSYSRI